MNKTHKLLRYFHAYNLIQVSMQFQVMFCADLESKNFLS